MTARVALMPLAWLSASVMAGLLAGTVSAQEAPPRAALIVQGDLTDPAARKGAEDLSEILFGMGFAVTRLENPAPAALAQAATATGRAAEALVVIGAGFAAGPAPAAGDPVPADAAPADPAPVIAASLSLPQGAVPLADLFASLRAGGQGGTLAVIVDACATGGTIPAGLGEALPADTLLALPAAPGSPCPAGAAGLMAGDLAGRIATPDTDLQALLAAADAPGGPLWTAGATPSPLVLRRGGAGQALTLADYRMLESLSDTDRAAMVANLRAAGFAVDIGDSAGAGAAAAAPAAGSSPVAAVSSPILGAVTTAVSPIRPAAAAATIVVGAEAQADDIIILASATRASAAAATAEPAEGLPRPYIILGRPPSLIEAVAPPQFDWQDSAARATAKADDPDSYAGLVAAGAWDPPPGTEAIALQTVLAEMNCYRGGIDGQFGNGSRRALTAYFETAGLQGVGQDPTPAVWRQVIAGPVVRCPDPPPQQAAQPRNTGGGGGQTSRPAQAAPAPAQAPRPAQSGGFQAGTGNF